MAGFIMAWRSGSSMGHLGRELFGLSPGLQAKHEIILPFAFLLRTSTEGVMAVLPFLRSTYARIPCL